MTDAAALLAAIIADPEDDTPRLVFADFLDEQDDRVPCPGCKGEGRIEQPNRAMEKRSKVIDYRPAGFIPVAIIECPTCRGSRSVPAGNAARAAFIRSQIEWSRMGKSDHCPCDPDGMMPNGEPCPCKWCSTVRSIRTTWDAAKARIVREHPFLAEWSVLPEMWCQDGHYTGSPLLVVSRGFPSDAGLPDLASFIGDRSCPACEEFNERRRADSTIGNPGHACKTCGFPSGLGRVRACPRVGDVAPGGGDVCGLCAGSGILPPLAAALARVPGITTVEIGDRVPDEIGDEVCWLRDREGLADNPAVLPDPIFDRLEGGRKEYAGIEWRDEDGVEDVWVVYPSLALATAALARAGGGLLAGLRLPHPEQPA